MPLNLMHFFAVVVLVAVPIYLSNSFALILGGKTSLDFGKNFFDGKPLFGKGKTFRGTIAGIVVGSVGALAVSVFLPGFTTAIGANYFHYGFLLAIGAMLGDIVGSFIKRRINLPRGESVMLLDQLDFVAGGILLGAILFTPDVWQIAFLAVLTLLMHKLANVIAFNARLKKVPW